MNKIKEIVTIIHVLLEVICMAFKKTLFSIKSPTWREDSQTSHLDIHLTNLTAVNIIHYSVHLMSRFDSFNMIVNVRFVKAKLE